MGSTALSQQHGATAAANQRRRTWPRFLAGLVLDVTEAAFGPD